LSLQSEKTAETVAAAARAWQIDAATFDRMREALTLVSEEAVVAIIDEVPIYRQPFTGFRGQRIRGAVQLALDSFLDLLLRTDPDAVGPDHSAPAARVREEAYDLGRGEARSGRTMDALLGAYRIGARVAWRALSREAIRGGMPAPLVGQFAERVFAYIDELSAASIAGHTDELETRGRVRERLRERLARAVVSGADEPELAERAARAAWEVHAGTTLTAVLVPTHHVTAARAPLPARTLTVTGDLPGLDDDTSLLLVPDVGAAGRSALTARLGGRRAVVGPERPWLAGASSYQRAVRALSLLPVEVAAVPPGATTGRPAEAPRDTTPAIDTEERLVDLVLLADREAYDDLRASALAPMAHLRPASRARLAETLRSWLLQRGRRELVAEELFVHAQTVRYRMGQLRELYGDGLDDPDTVLRLTVALGVDRPTDSSA